MKVSLLLLALITVTHGHAQSDSLRVLYPVDSGYFHSFDRTPIYYEVRGQGNPVLLVHGFIVNSNSWKHTSLYADLLKSGYQVILVDLRGNGKSGKPHTPGSYAHDAEAKDIMGLMSFLKIRHYSAVGYSRGSIITARLLVKDKRIQDAVLGGMGADFTNPEWPRRLMFYHALRGDSVPELAGMVRYVRQQKLDQQALAYLQEFQPSTSRQALGKISQPVLVVSGEKDTDNGSAHQLAKLIPRSAEVKVPGDHDHAASTPEFSGAVRAFFKRHHY